MIDAPLGSVEILSVVSSDAGVASGTLAAGAVVAAAGAGAGAAAVGAGVRPNIRYPPSATTTTAAAAAGMTHFGVPDVSAAAVAPPRGAVPVLRSALPTSAWNERISVGVAKRVSSSGTPSPADPSTRRIH